MINSTERIIRYLIIEFFGGKVKYSATREQNVNNRMLNRKSTCPRLMGSEELRVQKSSNIIDIEFIHMS